MMFYWLDLRGVIMKKKPKLNLKIWIPVGVVALLIIISLVLLMSSKTRIAFLNIEEGKVEVDSGKGWVDAVDGMKLSISDKVRTLNGKAVVILYESIIIQMDPDTEISIEELSKKNVKVAQNSGSTWNKFTAIAGLQNFEVETPTTVATVRGTTFWVDMESVGCVEGNVDVRMANKLLKLTAGTKAMYQDGDPVMKHFTEEDRQRALLMKEKIINHLKNLRQEEIEKHPTTYKLVKSLRGWDDGDVKRYMERLDKGEFSEDELKKKVVLPAETIEKFAMLTKEIRKEREALEALQAQETLPKAPEGDPVVDPMLRRPAPEGPVEEPVEEPTYVQREGAVEYAVRELPE
jgi:hypothetical protein